MRLHLILALIFLFQGASTTGSDPGKLTSSGSAPTLSACGGGSPAISGNNYAGKVTPGTVAVSCTLTFVPAFVNAPSCVATSQVLETVRATTTNTTLTLAGTDISSDVINYICVQIP